MTLIKKGDKVQIIAGKDKGKSGKVLHIDANKSKALVEGINLVKKTQRPTQENQQGGFIDIERPLHISNIALVDKKSNKPTRLGVKVGKDGKKTRIARKSGEVI